MTTLHGIEPFRGYRIWDISDRSGMLRSILSHEVWQPTMTARCPAGGSDTSNTAAHMPGCRRHGLHAFHLPDQLYGENVIGVVEGYGIVVRPAKGWRSSKARIVAVWADDAGMRAKIAAAYPTVPVFADRDAMLAEYPATVDPRTLYGPQGAEISALVRQVAALTGDEVERLTAAWAAARDAALGAALGAAWAAAGGAAWAAAGGAAWAAARAAAWAAARDAARAAALGAAGDAVRGGAAWAAALGAARAAAGGAAWAAAGDAAWAAARDAARDAAWALVARDLIGSRFTPERYRLLTGPLASVVGPLHPDDVRDDLYVPALEATG